MKSTLSKRDKTYPDDVPKPYLYDLHRIPLQRSLLEECYICLDEISNLNPAVFIHKCKHSICIECFRSLNTAPIKICGVCRAQSNEFVVRAKSFVSKRHNYIQSICVPTVLANSHPHHDLLQKMIVESYK